MLPFAEDLDAADIHVQAPTAVVFVCGGQCSSASVRVPLSLRDAFLKILDNPILRGRDIIRAEDVAVLSIFSGNYTDLLQFETDLAQITELIILFCESEGSLAELGAFTMVDEIAARLLVIMRDRHWGSDSFVTLGPLRYLENKHGRSAIYVLDDRDVNMVGQCAANVSLETLRDRLQEPLRTRLQITRDPTTFDPRRAGHVIKLIVGLVQEYGALTGDEIDELLLELNLDRLSATITAYLLCSETVGWTVKMRKGSTTYYFARNVPDAATFVLKEGRGIRNKTRRRLLIREHWRNTDILRDRGIREVFGSGVR